jgi:hypothetical protein
MKIVLESVVEAIGTRLDGSVKITLATQELDSNKAGDLFQLRNQFVKVLLSDKNISPLEETLVDEQKLIGGKKANSPQQRLRAVMFRVHESQGISIDFETWYKSEIENKINYYKQILNDNQ